MNQRIVLVTGANSGIGKETALKLLQQGYFVIIHGRNIDKTKRVYTELKQKTGSESMDMICADLSLMSQVKQMAHSLSKKYDKIDALINNAGGQFGSVREETAEGHEKTMAINVLAPFLLTHLLLPLLKKSEQGRVITVSSGSYTVGKFDAHDIELEHGYSLTRSYGLSKRYAYWIMMKYSQLGIQHVTFNTVEPGSTDSDLGRVSRQNKLANIVYHLWKPMMWSIEKAAATSVYMVTSNENGAFYGNCKPKKVKDKYRNQSDIDAVWNYCLKVCGEYLN